MSAEVRRAAAWGSFVTLVLAALIVAGSRNLEHFDAALVGYTFATLFATFAVTYRYTMWLQRPPTAIYWRRGWQVFTKRGHLARNLFVRWPKHVIGDIALNRFILNRGALRWLMHWLIMWGCILAILITFPLVFGWLYFASVPGDPEAYRVMVFGFPTLTFPAESALAFIAFHGLVWASFLVIPGVMLAMRRRMREEGAAALQRFAEDMLPLVALFAISVTGLMLTASYTWMDGYAYEFLAILHAVTVILWLLWLPFGKFFHIFQRPAQIGVRFYKDIGVLEEPATCRRCGHAFTSRMKVLDLIETERRLGYTYEMPDGGRGERGRPDTRALAAGSTTADGAEDAAAGAHYQWICPPCRRALLALAQGRLWSGSRGQVEGLSPMPVYANPGLGEGPLGTEDATNFHP